MASGQLQAAMLSVGGLSEIDPAVASLQEIPMLFHTLAEQEYVREQLRPELEKRLLAKGFVSLFWGDSGWVRFFSRSPAVRPADLKAQKIFVTAANSEKEMSIMQALGYKPVALDLTDVLLQLQTRGVDAVPAPPVIANAGQFYRFTKHMTELNWAPLVGATVITKRAWDTIPETARGGLMMAAAEAGKQIQAESRRESDDAVESMKKKWQLEVHPVSPEVEAEWRTLAESVYPKIRGSMVPEDMFDRAVKLVADYRATHK
jgi:TRAP-type C4-dicarboxylate transport system substrate-binding protein